MKEPMFCQSCGMPIDDPALRGTEADGTLSTHYCKYCYAEGKFTGEMTMDQMIDFCAPITAREMNIAPEEAKAQMRAYFPTLLRWKDQQA